MKITIPPDKIGDYAEERLTAILQSAVLELDARLKVGTPVETGRLRAGWQIGQDTDPVSVPLEAGPKAKPTDKDQARLVTDAGTQAIRITRTGPKGVNYTPGQEQLKSVYTISNNLEYAEPICYGTGLPKSWEKAGIKGSAKNPPPWAEMVAKGMEKYIAYNWDKMAREHN